MKKILGVSLLAVLVAAPMMAKADPGEEVSSELTSPTISTAALTTKGYVDTGLKYVYDLITDKADAADVYTKDEADQTFLTTQDIADKANAADVYTKDEADQLFLTEHQDISGKANAADVYTKDEADAKFLTSQDLSGLDGTAYNGTNGVKVQNHQVELNVNPVAGGKYVYTSTGWQPLEIAETWTAESLSGN